MSISAGEKAGVIHLRDELTVTLDTIMGKMNVAIDQRNQQEYQQQLKQYKRAFLLLKNLAAYSWQ